jgi:hypothetical protein
MVAYGMEAQDPRIERIAYDHNLRRGFDFTGDVYCQKRGMSI